MTDTAKPTFLDRQKEAALADVRQQQEERQRISAIVLGDKPRGQRRVTEVIRLGDDYLVQVANKGAAWTFVVGGRHGAWYHERQEDALLHLIATRYDAQPSNSITTAFYAGRVLGRPES